MKTTLLLIFMSVTLQGCSLLTADKSTITKTVFPDGIETTVTTNVANNDTASHYGAYNVHRTTDSTKILSMAASIATMPVSKTCTGECLGYANSMKMITIGWGINLKSTPFTETRPTSGMDAIKAGVEGVVKLGTVGIPAYAGVKVVDTIFDSVGNDIHFGADGTMADSFNEQKHEVHATSVGDDTTLDSTLDIVPEEAENVPEESVEPMPGEVAK